MQMGSRNSYFDNNSHRVKSVGNQASLKKVDTAVEEI